MDPFRGRAPRHLTALRQFRTRVPIQDSGAAFGMTRPNGPARQQSGPYEIPGHAHYLARSHSRIEVRSSYEKYSFALGAGKVALVTGGSSGIGLASAEELIREGAFVYITGRKKAELDAAANRLGQRCVSIQADISKMEDIDRIYKKIAGDGKALDVLFANAGGGSFAPLGSITEEQYDATFTTNVKGTLFTVQKSLPHLNDGSSIILNASIASVKGIPGLSRYSAAN